MLQPSPWLGNRNGMSKKLLYTLLICLSLLAVTGRPGVVLAGGSAPEEVVENLDALVETEPTLDVHERRAAVLAAALVVSRARQDQASLMNLPTATTARMRPERVWTQSLAVAQTRRLSLPAGGSVSRGYDRRLRHYGVDIQLARNAPVYAAADGVVVHAGWDNKGYGRMVWIDHGNGLRTLYAHLNVVLVESGRTVQRGQVIGLAGSTGHSTGPHLHFEVKQDNVKLDPLAFFPDGRAPNEDDFVVASSPAAQEDQPQ